MEEAAEISKCQKKSGKPRRTIDVHVPVVPDDYKYVYMGHLLKVV